MAQNELNTGNDGNPHPNLKYKEKAVVKEQAEQRRAGLGLIDVPLF